MCNILFLNSYSTNVQHAVSLLLTLYNKVPDLASDPKERFNIGLYIIQNQ